MGPTQKDAFVHSEADAYFRRNPVADLDGWAGSDPVLALLRAQSEAPSSALEIGAGGGWRLEALRSERPGMRCAGIEPSSAAVEYARANFPDIEMLSGTAEALPFEDRSFELVIFGFVLYLCDRDDLFRIAAEADRVVTERGRIVIYDFRVDRPYRNQYAHREGIYSYKMDYARMFTWNPCYRLVAENRSSHPGGSGGPDDSLAVSMLARDPRGAYAEGPPDTE